MKLENLLKKMKCSGKYYDVALAGVGKSHNIAFTDCIDDCYDDCDCSYDCRSDDCYDDCVCECDCNCDCYSDD